jgi:two-component system, NtrC family, sensor kinase
VEQAPSLSSVFCPCSFVSVRVPSPGEGPPNPLNPKFRIASVFLNQIPENHGKIGSYGRFKKPWPWHRKCFGLGGPEEQFSFMKRARILRLAISLAFALLVVGLGGLSVYRKVAAFQPLGFEPVSPVPQGAGMVVAAVEAPGSGLRRGDQILSVNGGDVPTRSELVQRLKERSESQLVVLRGEQLLKVRYQRPPLAIDFPFLILSLIGGVYLAIGLYTLLRHGGRQSLLFYLWCLASAAVYLLTPTSPVDLVFRAITLADTVAFILLPALTLHLFLVFPSSPLPIARARRLVPFFYLPAAVLLTLQLDLMLARGRWIFGAVTVARVQRLESLARVHFIVLAIAAVALLFWRFRRSAGWEQHRQMKWMAYGVMGGYLPFLALYYAPYALHLRVPELLTSAAVVPLALVPITFAYAILRYKLWDIEVIARDAISWTLTLLLGIIGFSMINLAINRGISEELSLARNLLSFVSGLGIAGLLAPARGAISSALERVHYGGSLGKRRALADFGRELLHERDLSRLCASLLHRIVEGLEIAKANVYLAQGDSLQAFRLEPDLPERMPFDALGEDLWRRDCETLAGVVLPGEPAPTATCLFVAGYRYAFPLTVRGRALGLVLAGFKDDLSALNSEDTEIVRHLLDQAALAIENAQLMGQLQLQLEYTEGIFESSPAGIAVLDGERRLVSANTSFATIVGRNRNELTGASLETVLPVTPLPAPGEGPIEVSWCDGAGVERHLQLSLAAFERGWRQGLYVLVVHDVSERVAMENALREKDRLASLGMLAAGVAHEVNTPITGISSYAQMLLDDTSPGDPRYEILKKVERQTFRAARIVNNLLEFARKRQSEPKPVAMAPLISESLDLLSDRCAKRRIDLQWEPPGERIQVMGCDGELQQVFTNLILNAIDAMSETGGRLAVDVEASESKVVVRVKDSGPGVPPDKLEMIFQPFYSTKLNRGGTGLGLSISYEIVRRHGGDLRVVSQPGEGAAFVVELPRYHPSPLATA